MALLALRLAVLLVFFLIALRLERRGRGVLVVLAVLGIVVADAALYADSEAASTESLFNPDLFGQSFRLTQLVIPLALLARLVVRGLPHRVHASAPLWIAFFAWVAISAVTGLLQGHEPALALRQTAVIIHVGGGLALAAGVPASEYAHGRELRWFLRGAAAVAVVLFLTDTSGMTWTSFAVPDLPLDGVGVLGADAATVFASLGLLGLLLAASWPQHLSGRLTLLIPSALLILSHLATPQRAARLGLYVSLLALAVVASTAVGRRRLRFGPGRALVGLGIAAAATLAVVLWRATMRVWTAPSSTAIGADSDSPFGVTSRQGSVQSRFNQWDVVREQISERPLVGHGLGDTTVHYDAGSGTFTDSDITHNIVLDLLFRTGSVGLLLIVAALAVVIWSAAAAWRGLVDDRVAALATAASLVVLGLLTKGMVESIFEKYRLAVLLGVFLGIAVSACMEWERERSMLPTLADRGDRAPGLTRRGS